MLSRLVGSVTQALDFNAATLSGCIDIIVVPQDDGSLRSTPFHVRFGKARVLRSRDKVIEVLVNNTDSGIRMTLGAAGEAYFNLDEFGESITPTSEEEEEDTMDRSQIMTNDIILSADDSLKNQHQDDLTNNVTPDVIDVGNLGRSKLSANEGLSTSPTAASPGILNMKSTILNPPIYGEIPFIVEFSVCGHILQGGELDKRVDNDVFEANMIQYDLMNASPELWYHPSLVARFNKEPPFYPAKAAMPLVMSLIAFNKSMSSEAIFRLMNSTISVTPPEGPLANFLNTAGLGPLAQLVQHHHPHHIKTPTGRSISEEDQDEEQPQLSSPPKMSDMEASDHPNDLMKSQVVDQSSQEKARDCTTGSVCGGTLCGEYGDEVQLAAEEAALLREASKSLDLPLSIQDDISSASGPRRSLRPTSRHLEIMKLNWGENAVEFRLSGTTQSVHGTICLWERDAKIVVSDVDGTITRSDLMGQLAPMVGKDWSHAAVTKLFTRIQRNGFHMLYLTARAIGQADITRDYLFGLADGASGSALPRGPLFLSPDRLFTSFKREVIDRTPFIFKIAALKDIRGLFPSSYNPFYAGFGNRNTDHKAYTHIGIPEGKVFIINSSGIVHHVNSAYATSYESMADIAHQMFPHLQQSQRHGGSYDREAYVEKLLRVDSTIFADDDQFNDFDYWATPLPSASPFLETPMSLMPSQIESISQEICGEGENNRRLSRSSSFERPVSRELIGLRRKLLRVGSTSDAHESIDTFDLDQALSVTPFAELAQMYSILNEFCPPNEQAHLLGLGSTSEALIATNTDGSWVEDLKEVEESDVEIDRDTSKERMERQSSRDNALLESIIQRTVERNSMGSGEYDDLQRIQADLWESNSLLSRLEDKLWSEMIELRGIYSGNNQQLEEATSRILGIPYEPKYDPAPMVDPGLWPLDPQPPPSSRSPSKLFGWRS